MPEVSKNTFQKWDTMRITLALDTLIKQTPKNFIILTLKVVYLWQFIRDDGNSFLKHMSTITYMYLFQCPQNLNIDW